MTFSFTVRRRKLKCIRVFYIFLSLRTCKDNKDFFTCPRYEECLGIFPIYFPSSLLQELLFRQNLLLQVQNLKLIHFQTHQFVLSLLSAVLLYNWVRNVDDYYPQQKLVLHIQMTFSSPSLPSLLPSFRNYSVSMTQQMQNLQLSHTRKCSGGPASPSAAKRLYRNLSEKLKGGHSSFEDAYFFGRGERHGHHKGSVSWDCVSVRACHVCVFVFTSKTFSES